MRRGLLLLILGILLVPVPVSAYPPAEPPCEPIGALAGHAPPVGIGSCSGVRPGALVQTPLGYCTLNFLFEDQFGRRYIGTAGHCILEKDGERRWRSGGPWAKDGRGARIGSFAYAVLNDTKDFALIRLDRGVHARASMCHFGGPTGYNADTRGMKALHYYGNGIGIGEVLPARTAIAAYAQNRHQMYAYGFVIFGDSGSAVIDDRGDAVGVAVTTGAHWGGVFHNGLMGVTRIVPQVQRAEDVMDVDLRLRKAARA